MKPNAVCKSIRTQGMGNGPQRAVGKGMKSAIQIGVVTALLLASLTPLRSRLAGTVKPVVARVETALNHRYPALHAIQILLLHHDPNS